MPPLGIRGLWTVSLLNASRLLPCHGQVQPFLWSEEVIIALASSRILELPARLWKGCWQHPE
jgi:hypothetical protein